MKNKQELKKILKDYKDIASGLIKADEVRKRNALIPEELCKEPIDWKKNKNIKF